MNHLYWVIIFTIWIACVPRLATDHYQMKSPQFTQAKKELSDARTLIHQGNFSTALPLLTKSLPFYQENNSHLCSDIFILMGDCYKQTKQFEKSEHAYQSALSFDKKTYAQVSPYISRDYNRLASLFLEKSEYYQALLYINNAIDIDWQLYQSPHFDTARDLTVQAILYERLGNYDKAITIQEKVLDMIRQIYGHRHEHTTAAMNNLATSLFRVKKFKEAAMLFEKTLDIDQAQKKQKHDDIARDLNNLGVIFRKTKNYDRAIKCFQKALNIYKSRYGPWHTSVAATLNNLGNVQTELKLYQAAEKSFSKAMTIAQAIRDINLSWHIWDGLRELFSAQGKMQAAIFFGKQAVFTIQTIRNNLFHMPKEWMDSFIKSKADVYRALAELFINEGRLNEAQWVLQLLKDEEYFQVTLSSINRGGNVKTSQSIFSELEQSWKNKYQNIQKQLIRISEEYQLLMDKDLTESLTDKEMDRFDQLEMLLDKNQEYVQNYIDQLIHSFDHIQDMHRQKDLAKRQLNTIKGMKHSLKQLGKDVVLIHYIVMSDCVHILLTTPDIQLTRQSTVTAQLLNQTVFAFRKAIEERNVCLHEAQLLYQWLIAPIEQDLKQANTKILMLSLDEMLRYAPFCAFHTGKKYLSQLYQTVIYTEAARDKLNILPDRSGKIAGVGLSKACPRFHLPALKAVPEEIESIVFHGPNDASGLIEGIVHLNETFSFKNFRRILRRRYAYLHIASHFVLISGDEKSSFLILGDQTTINLMDIEKKCDFNGVHLLTLSACNTAMGGSGHSGREIEGFGALAQNNGAQSVLASLWAVNDSSTGVFMQQFYSYFVQRNSTSKSGALQQAQLFFLNHPNQARYQHPFFWAAFILMGNFR